MSENKSTYQVGREVRLELIDDMFCDIYAEAHKYAADDVRRERLRRDLLEAINALREWQQEKPPSMIRVSGMSNG